MAKNRKFESGDKLSYAIAGKSSGDAAAFGQLAGVCLTDTDADGNVTMQTNGVFELSVVGADGAGNAAIAAGDKVYVDGSAVNADSTNGVFLGWALAAVSSGATTTINVKVGN